MKEVKITFLVIKDIPFISVKLKCSYLCGTAVLLEKIIIFAKQGCNPIHKQSQSQKQTKLNYSCMIQQNFRWTNSGLPYWVRSEKIIVFTKTT